jgi:hypothetical protein
MPDVNGPRRLPDIVAGLHSWLRSRICVILITPRAGGGWEAVLMYVAKTLPPPPELHIAPAQAAEPSDTHHALALPPIGVEAALREQLRELADIRELGTLQVEKLPAGAGPLDPPLPQPAWRITTHSGLQHQRRTWLSRIGRRDLGR